MVRGPALRWWWVLWLALQGGLVVAPGTTGTSGTAGDDGQQGCPADDDVEAPPTLYDQMVPLSRQKLKPNGLGRTHTPHFEHPPLH